MGWETDEHQGREWGRAFQEEKKTASQIKSVGGGKDACYFDSQDFCASGGGNLSPAIYGTKR